MHGPRPDELVDKAFGKIVASSSELEAEPTLNDHQLSNLHGCFDGLKDQEEPEPPQSRARHRKLLHILYRLNKTFGFASVVLCAIAIGRSVLQRLAEASLASEAGAILATKTLLGQGSAPARRWVFHSAANAVLLTKPRWNSQRCRCTSYTGLTVLHHS